MQEHQTALQLSMSLSGVDELLAAINELGQVGGRQALQGAMKEGAELIRDEASRLARRGPDIGPRSKAKQHLPDTIVVRTTLSKEQRRKRGGRRAEAEVFVGSTAPHAHLIEFGHRLVKGKTRKGKVISHVVFRDESAGGQGSTRGRYIRHVIEREAGTFGKVIGHVPAYPFMRPAFDARREQATEVLFKSLGEQVVRVARRYRRQAERGKLTRGAKLALAAEIGL